MSLNAESSARICLRTTEDWTLWADQFKSKAKRAQLWDYIDPEASQRLGLSLNEAIVAPSRPQIKRFYKRNADGNRSASVRATDVTELHIDDMPLWTALNAEYTSERKDHELLMKKIDNLQEWMRETVSSEHLRRYCTADKEIDEWYASLKLHLGIDLLDRKTRARQEYAETLAIPHRKRLSTKKEVEDWLNKWDQAYHELLEAGFEDPKEASLWFAEYTQALGRSCYETWIYSYHSSHLEEMRKNTLTPAKVLQDTRFFLNSIANDHMMPRGKAKPGAFGPTTAEGSPTNTTKSIEDTNDNQERNNFRGRGRRGRGHRGAQRGRNPRSPLVREGTPRDSRSSSRPIKREWSEGEERSGKCEACYGFHPLSACYYAIEEIRPDWWKADGRITELVKS
ncbi:Gag protein [Fusarium sp. Ph1]|nr:Gag protein [Fusarium sp. Ph1]